MASRATKGEIRDLVRDLDAELRTLKDAVTADDGAKVVAILQYAEASMEDLRESLEDRYSDAFDEIEGEVIEEIEVEGEEEIDD